VHLVEGLLACDSRLARRFAPPPDDPSKPDPALMID
jgi:hypothetical protein